MTRPSYSVITPTGAHFDHARREWVLPPHNTPEPRADALAVNLIKTAGDFLKSSRRDTGYSLSGGLTAQTRDFFLCAKAAGLIDSSYTTPMSAVDPSVPGYTFMNAFLPKLARLIVDAAKANTPSTAKMAAPQVPNPKGRVVVRFRPKQGAVPNGGVV